MVGNLNESFGVEIGQGQAVDLALVAQRRQLLQCVQVTLVTVFPPVELQQVQTLDAHAPQGYVHVVLNDLARHRTRARHPLGECLYFGPGGVAPFRRQSPAELADEVLSRPVVVGQVPGGETGIVVRQHRIQCGGGVNAAVGPRHLPHAVEYPANGQAVDETEAGFWREGHGDANLNYCAGSRQSPEYQPDMIGATAALQRRGLGQQ